MQAPFADPLSGLELLNKALPLVGRDIEMQAIRALLDTVSFNRPPGPRALVISGDIGIGKSRLLAEMYIEARSRGFQVLEGRTYASGSAFPYLPFIEALRPILRFATPQDLRRYVGLVPAAPHHQHSGEQTTAEISLTGAPLVASLARLFPELAATLQVNAPPEILSPDQEKFRLFDAIATLLEGIATERPILLGIDNLQWADSASLELMMYLTVRLHSSQVALAGVTRPPGASAASADTGADRLLATASIPAARALNDLVGQGLLLLLPLAPLDAGASERHLHALLPGTLPLEIAQSLLARAEGNPFFLEELVRALTLNQLLVLRNGVWKARSINADIPASITLAVQQRLHGLSTPCRELLRVASLCGRTFPLAVTAQVLAQSEDTVQISLNEALEATIIAREPVATIWEDFAHDNETAPENSSDLASSLASTGNPTLSPSFMFCQGIVQEVLSAELPSAQARLLHGDIGAALERHYGAAVTSHAPELARHYALSDNIQAALRWSLLAGEDAARQQAHREAVRQFRFVLSLLEQHTGNLQGQPLPSPAHLHILIGESWFKLGELEQASTAFQQALQALQASGTSDTAEYALLLARANRLLGDVYRMQGKYDQALAHLQEARTAFDTQAVAQSTHASTDVTSVTWFPGRSFPGIPSTISPQRINTTERILFLQAQATLDIMLGHVQEAEHGLWQSHQLATQMGDRSSQAFALQMVGWLRGWGEHIHGAIRFQEQAHELYVAAGDPFRAALVDQVLGIVYQATGDMERARLCTMRGFERARRYGARRILGLLHWNFGAIALAQGDWNSSESHLQQALQEAGASNDTRLKPIVLQALAELQFRRGNWHAAEQLFQASIQAASTTEWLASTVALYGHFLAVTGRRNTAREHLDRAAALTEPPGLPGSFYIPFLAEGYLHLGDNAQAAAYIQRIRSMHGFMYYGISVGRILGEVAALSGDWETAERAFEEGLAVCRRARNEPEEAAIFYEQARTTLMRSASADGPWRDNIEALCKGAREIFQRYDMQRSIDLVDTLQQGVHELAQINNAETARRNISSSHEAVRLSISIPQAPSSDYQLSLRLTGRELEVLRLVAEGHTDREVAETLVISPRTVNRHLSNIFVKLDVPGRAAAVAYAIRQGIV